MGDRVPAQGRHRLDLAWILVTGWSSVLGESRMQRSEQGFLWEGLAQNRHGFTGEIFCRNLLFPLGRDKNDRRADIFSRQQSLQLEAAHPRHSHVQDETSGAG